MKRKLFFALVAAIFLVPWTAAYAHNTANASAMTVDIQTAPTPNQPAFNIYGGAIGSVIPGELFTIDCSGKKTDTAYNLYITNTDELVKSYRYINLQIGIYSESENGVWRKITGRSGDSAADLFITIQNSRVNFLLTGGARYKIKVDKGCFNCYPAIKGQNAALPAFYLTTGV